VLPLLLSFITWQTIAHHARLAAAGLITTGVNWAAVWALLAIMGVGGLIGVAIAFVLSNGVNFLLQKFWAYQAHCSAAHGRQLAAYMALMGLSFALNEGLFALFSSGAHLSLFFTQTLTTIILSLVGYFGSKYIFVFVR
jgi:putative flippase GtrA